MSKLAKNTAFYTLGSILPQAAGFILLPLYAKFLSPADYGIIGSMEALKGFLVILFTLSIDKGVVRLYWDYKGDERKVFLGIMTISILSLSIIGVTLFFALKPLISNIFKDIDFFPFYVYTTLSTLLSSFQLVPKKYLLLSEQAPAFVGLSILQFILRASFTIYLVVFMEQGAIGSIMGGFYSLVLMLPIYLVLTYRYVIFKFTKHILLEALRFSLPLTPPFFMTWLVTSSNRIFLERYVTLDAVGLFSLGMIIIGAILIFSSAFNNAYNPIFFRLANSDNQIQAINSLKKHNDFYVMFSFLLVFGLGLFSRDIVLLLFDERYHELVFIIPMLLGGTFWGQLSGINGRAFQQSKEMKLNMYISFSTGFVNLGLNYFLIIWLNIYGAILAFILTNIYSFWVSYYFTYKRCYFIPIDWLKIASVLIIGVFLIYLMNFILTPDILISIIIKSIIFLFMIYTVYRMYSKIVLELIGKTKVKL